MSTTENHTDPATAALATAARAYEAAGRTLSELAADMGTTLDFVLLQLGMGNRPNWD